MVKIKIIDQEEAQGELRLIYDGLLKSRGKIAEVHKIMSLRPSAILKHMDLYMEIMYSKSELTRAEREMMGVVVSKANNCDYCQVHHAEALNHYWKNDHKVNMLKTDYPQAGLPARENLLCQWAWGLTLDPGYESKSNIIEKLRAEGLSDKAILDGCLVIAYFNFINRIVLALGVNLEEDLGKGYKF